MERMEISLNKNIYSERGKFKYFCGVFWTKIKANNYG